MTLDRIDNGGPNDHLVVEFSTGQSDFTGQDARRGVIAAPVARNASTVGAAAAVVGHRANRSWFEPVLS